MCFTAIATLGAAAIGASSANRASRAQQRSARDQIEYSERTRDMIRADLAPYREGGLGAFNALQYHAGLGDKPADYAGFTASPGYQFRLGEGLNAVSGMAAANGSLNSGSTMKALNDYAQGQASAEYGNHINMLSGIAGSGQNAAAGTATAMTNNNQFVNNALGSIGNAQAAGAIGVGNAVTGAINNGIGLWNYQNALNSGRTQTAGQATPGFGLW